MDPIGSVDPDNVIVRDVTLREFGQNVPSGALGSFGLEARLWLAEELLEAGLQTIEVASTASNAVAPAMSQDLLRPFLESLGNPENIELLTLVPGRSGYRRFSDLHLGPEGLGHSMGVFVSAMDEHNMANLRRTVDETLDELAAFVPEAVRGGTKVIGYVSAAFGFRPSEQATTVTVSSRKVGELVEVMATFGASSVTLSDLQGIASPQETEELLAKVIRESHVPIGYHPHHISQQGALDNVEAAYRAGIRLFDASLGAVGGCVTGAPGNAPTEGVVTRLHELGATTNLDAAQLSALAREAMKRIFQPVRAWRNEVSKV